MNFKASSTRVTGRIEGNRQRRERAMEKKNSNLQTDQCPGVRSRMQELVLDLLFGCCKRGVLG